MKRIYYVLFAVIIVLISIECRKELSGENAFPGQGSYQSSPISATLQGNIIDENDQPAEGVVVTVGTKTATTNSHGYFRITDASLDKNASLVTAEQAGYFKAYRTFSATSGVNQVVIKLIKKTLAGTIDAASGGSVTLSNGSKVLLAANGVTKANGTAYAGSVSVYASYIDPASNDIGKKVPGSFMGDDKNNKRVVLSSYGMLAVNLESSAGEKLQIAANSSAALTIPIPTSISSSAPASISLWYIDEQTGVWKEQGTAQKEGNNYVGNVKHFSYWNCDSLLPAIGFSATFKTSENVPLANTYIVIKPNTSDSANGFAHGYTDSLGQINGLIPANINLTIEIYDQCGNVVYSKNIGPFAANTDLGTIIISNSANYITTIKGKLLSCSNTPVMHGYATIYFNDFVYNVSVNDQGEFSTNIISCYGIPGEFQILGVDETAQQQGTLTTFSVNSQVIDAGNIMACGTSSAQYINYNVDGVDHTISNNTNDSFYCYTSTSVNQFNTYDSYITGYHAPDNFSLYFSGDKAAGVYPVNFMSVLNYNRIGLAKPFNTTLTSFPQNIGDYYEGNFSGSFIDSSAITVTHNINCSFRIRKNN
jgi:hypothetical protein